MQSSVPSKSRPKQAVSPGANDRASLQTAVREHGGRAVTRSTQSCTAFIYSHLRATSSGNAACRGNATFAGMNFKRDDCALSRAQRRVDSAPWQVFVPAPTRWGLTTPPRGRRIAPLYPLSSEEKHRCSKKLLSDGAVWTAYRPAPARVLVTRFAYHLASMSQLRFTVLVTPLCATAPRLDLNTYLTFGLSSKQRRELGHQGRRERSKSVFNVHNVHDVHKRRGYRACPVNVVNIVNIENRFTPSVTGGASVPTYTAEVPLST